MKPLTIEQLKSLEVGDWVWVVIDNEEELCCHTSYYKLDKKIHYDIGINTLSFTGVEEDPELALSIYGTKWLAYKNKEEAECKGEIVELPCLRDKPTLFYHGEPILRKELNYMTDDGTICSVSYSKDEFAEAEHRLAELKGEVNRGKKKYV